MTVQIIRRCALTADRQNPAVVFGKGDGNTHPYGTWICYGTLENPDLQFGNYFETEAEALQDFAQRLILVRNTKLPRPQEMPANAILTVTYNGLTVALLDANEIKVAELAAPIAPKDVAFFLQHIITELGWTCLVLNKDTLEIR